MVEYLELLGLIFEEDVLVLVFFELFVGIFEMFDFFVVEGFESIVLVFSSFERLVEYFLFDLFIFLMLLGIEEGGVLFFVFWLVEFDLVRGWVGVAL